MVIDSADGTTLGDLPVSIDYLGDGKGWTPGVRSTFVPATPARLADVSGVAAGHAVSVNVAGVDGVPRTAAS